MSPTRFLPILFLSLGCAACATLNESECRSGDWRQIGYQDGLRGRATSRLADHQKSCGEHGIAADTTAWHIGYVEGQGQYCTARSGYLEGRKGNAYADVCPPETDRAFRPAYEDGRHVAAQIGALNELDRRLQQLDATLQEDDRRGAAYLDAIRNGRKPPEAGRLLRGDERGAAEREFEQLGHEYRERREDLEHDDAALSERHGAARLLFDFRD